MNYGKEGVRQQQQKLNSKTIKWEKKAGLIMIKAFLVVILACIIMGISGGIGVFKGILATSPDIGNINVTPTGYSTFVYDSKGNQTAKLVSTDSNRIPVTMDQVPKNLANAFVAIEDVRFYQHNGIDIKGIMRAGVKGLTTGNFSEGASTITQQLLKNNVFTSWTSESSFSEKLRRKIQEQYLALELEKVMSKKDILINYMNTINLGQNTLGVQAASLRYFNKDVSKLSLSECAVIAGITQNPSKFNPITHPDKNKERRDKVLKNMLDQGYISESDYETAMDDDVYSRIQKVDSENTDNTVNSYFVDALTDDVLSDLVAAGYTETQAYTMLYSGGLKIYSTQDPDIQKICDNVCTDENNYPADTKWYLNYSLTVQKSDGTFANYSTEMLKQYFKQQNAGYNLTYASKDAAYDDINAYKASVMSAGDEVYAENVSLTPQPQISFTVENQSTGEIVALEGGRGTKSASRTLNRATGTLRQPGSTFKVVSTYAPALDSAGLTLASVQVDEPYSYAGGRPVKNWYKGYRGICSLRDGIRDSLNIVAVKTLTQITPQLGFDYLKNFGFTTLVESRVGSDGKTYSDINQTLALGGITDGVTNKELNAAYACIANGGTYVKPKLYTKVVDHDGKVILDNTKAQTKQVIKATTAFLLTSAMEDVVTSGTGASCNFGGTAIAGKTGTTTDYKDVWFSGFTTYYTATAWAGYDNNISLSSTAEKALAKKIWRECMSKIHENLKGTTFQVPSGIVQATVCSKSGKLPIPGLCDATLKTEYFAEGTVPTEQCDVHYQGYICAYDNLPACENCPFKYYGVLERTPGSNTTTTTDANGNTVTQQTLCRHNDAFFADPNHDAVIQQEQLELQQRQAAAAAAAAAAGQTGAAAPAAGTGTAGTAAAGTGTAAAGGDAQQAADPGSDGTPQE
jgi:penicillin-binding protein 1A